MQDGGQITVRLDGQILATLTVPNTGSLTTWQVVSTGLTLPVQNEALLKIEFAGTGFRLNWIGFEKQLPYHGSPSPLPGRVEFEDFDLGGADIAYYDNTPLVNYYGQYRTNDGVEIMGITDGTAGFAVYADQSEWLEFTCAMQPGIYTVVVRHTSSYPDQQLTLWEGDQYRATFVLPYTGSWGNWQNTAVQDVFFEGGQDCVLRFSMDTNYALLNYFDFTRQYNEADADLSGFVDMDDIILLSAQWQGVPGDPSADIFPPEGDGQVDMLDLMLMADNWLCYY